MKTVRQRAAPGQPLPQRHTAKLQRRRVEEAFQERGFRTVFDANPDYVYVTDIEGRIVDANAALLKRVGLSLEQMRKKRFIDFFAGDNPTEVLQAFAALKSGQEVKGLAVRAWTARRQIFDYEVNAIPLWEGQKVVATLNMARGVTAHKQAEEQLRNVHQQLRALEDVVYGVKKILEGGISVSAVAADKLAVTSAKNTEKLLHGNLSPREYQVMRLLAVGKTVGQIAKELFLSVKTISTHRAHILEKMHLKNNAELIRYAIIYHVID